MKVIDASAVAALLLDEPEANEIAARMAGEALVAPGILAFEFTNVCTTKALRFPEKEIQFAKALDAFIALEIELQPIDLVGTFALAREFNLSAYDASYLWLARELGVELVTLDGKLERASLAT
jgi:predicted nucleic acid-binding protein